TLTYQRRVITDVQVLTGTRSREHERQKPHRFLDLLEKRNGRGERIRTSDPLVPNSRRSNSKCLCWCRLGAERPFFLFSQRAPKLYRILVLLRYTRSP